MSDDAIRTLLLGRLSAARRHILAQVEGLSDDQLRRPVLPSGWSVLGLLRHLTVSDEHYWFEHIVAGEPLQAPEGENADWSVGSNEAAEGIIEGYRTVVASAEAIVAARAMSDAPAVREEWWDQVGLTFPDLTSVVVHMLVETSTHAGHLDAARELIDGKQYLVL